MERMEHLCSDDVRMQNGTHPRLEVEGHRREREDDSEGPRALVSRPTSATGGGTIAE